MPPVTTVNVTLTFEPVLARDLPLAVATRRKKATASPARELSDLLEVAVTRPQLGSCNFGRVAVLSVMGISVVSSCLAFWVAVASALFSG